MSQQVDAEFIGRLVAEQFAEVATEIRRHGHERYAMDHYAELAVQVGKQLGRDRAAKERIVARAPYAFDGMDAGEYAGASAVELATRELKALGVPCKNSDPIEVLDSHHAGRDFARAQGRGVHGVAVKSSVMEGMDASGNSFMDKYLGS